MAARAASHPGAAGACGRRSALARRDRACDARRVSRRLSRAGFRDKITWRAGISWRPALLVPRAVFGDVLAGFAAARAGGRARLAAARATGRALSVRLAGS